MIFLGRKGLKKRLTCMPSFEKLLHIAAPSSLPILLLGESGSGKEVAARRLHSLSSRAHGPFIPVNCGALAPGLLESLLCGHLRGAFTGADREQLGFVRAAAGGTLFLDELGELPLEAQCRLLRILQERCVTPLGSQKEIGVDFRLVCATHHDLEEDVRQGRFRSDLYFRIAVLPIRVPALRERSADFAALAQSLWQEIADSKAPPLEARQILLLASQAWPGNIRQLRNVLERYALLRPHQMSLEDILAGECFALFGRPALPAQAANDGTWEKAPLRERIRESLRAHNDNKSRAAQALGISRGCLCHHLRKEKAA